MDHTDAMAAQLAQLDELLAAIKGFADPRAATAQWKQAYNLLKKTPAAGNGLDNVVARRDVAQLAALIDGLRPRAGAAAEGAGAEGEAAAAAIDDATLKAAMKAFKRRLKLQRLDEESRIDLRDPMSKGGSAVTAIEPPREWPMAVWAELDRRGALRRVGAGLYEYVADLAV